MLYCHKNTSTHSVIEDAIFGRMDDIGDMFKKEVHEEFVSNELLEHNTNLFPEYSYMYILVAYSGSSDSLCVGEKKWSEILTTEQNIFLQTHKALIVGYMLMTPEHPKDIYLIEYINSRITGYNIADCMIKKLENEMVEFEKLTDGCKQVKPKCVIPREIISSSKGYWVKYFDRRLGVKSKEDLDKVKNTLHINNLVNWFYLENIYIS